MAKILIIGGGVAGLSAGIYARLSGHEAVICEKHFLPGGNLTGWSRGEYHIDNCVHWLTGSNPASPMHKMWIDLGALGNDVEIIQGNTLFCCDKNGKRIILPPSLSELEKQLLEVSPEDKGEIKKFIRAIDFMQGTDHVAGKDCNEGITLGRALSGVGPLMRYFSRTTGQLASMFKNPEISHFITGFWGDDFGALALIYVFATYCGRNGALPKGGSLKMAERMADRFTSLGGKLCLRREAVRLNCESGRAKSVSFSDGTKEEADYVIFTTEPAVTFGKIIDAPMPKEIKALYDNPKMRRFSAYHCAFGCDAAELPFEGDLIFDVPEHLVKELGTKQLIVREFSHEPGFAPEGKNILQTLTFCYEDDARAFITLYEGDKAEYRKRKEKLAEIICKLIEEHCPTLQGKLSLIDVWTPASYKRIVNTEIGSFMSFAMPSGYAPKTCSARVGGLENVLLATQWQKAPGGLPIAAINGKTSIEIINKIEKKK